MNYLSLLPRSDMESRGDVRNVYQAILYPHTVRADSKEDHKTTSSGSSGTPAKQGTTLPWKRLVAGAVAGTADVWACHPLDRVKTHLQNNPKLTIKQSFLEIWNKGHGATGGIKSLYEGIFPMTAEAVVKVGIRYFAFQFFTEQYNLKVYGDKHKPSGFVVNLLGGAFAGTVESFIAVIPCELLKVRHMTQTTHLSFGTVFKNIIKEEGVLALYKGGSATLLRQVTNHMVRFPVFYSLTNYLKDGDHHKKLPVWQNLCAGAFAGTCSTLVNNPLDTIKTRMQKQGQDKRAIEVIAQIYRDGGLRAYWAGVSTRILRVAPGQAITWAVVEWMIGILGKD